MIERKFIAQKVKELQIQQYVVSQLGKIGNSKIEIKKTPLGEKIVIYSNRPGIIVGRKGENIKKLTTTLKNKFKLENPQIEIGEATNPLLDAAAVADKIAFTLERYGSKRFKFIGYDVLKQMIAAGALGGEVVISGKVPSSRAKTWRFLAGYLKKSGDVSVSQVQRACTTANLRSGIIGIKVSIMPPDVKLPDKIIVHDPEIKVEVTDGTEVAPVQHQEKKEQKKKPKRQRRETADENPNIPREPKQQKKRPSGPPQKKQRRENPRENKE